MDKIDALFLEVQGTNAAIAWLLAEIAATDAGKKALEGAMDKMRGSIYSTIAQEQFEPEQVTRLTDHALAFLERVGRLAENVRRRG